MKVVFTVILGNFNLYEVVKTIMKLVIITCMEYRIAQNFGGVKLWRINHFRVLAGENVDEFTIANIATLVNLEFAGIKYWRMVFGSPN